MNRAILPTTVTSADQTVRFKKLDGQNLIIDDDVIKQFSKFRQTKLFSREAGGLLLGRHLVDTTHIAVDNISKPMKGDRRTRTSFFRSEGHEKYAHECWNNSGGTCGYLGNWHTHPEPFPTPSIVDIEDWLNVLKNDVYEGERLYFIIVGTKELACWEGDSQNMSINRIEVKK